MEHKSLKQLHKSLSWNTKIYTLMAIVVVMIAKFTDALANDFALTIILAILAVLLVESFVTVSVRHPRLWKYLKWFTILVGLAMILMGGIHF